MKCQFPLSHIPAWVFILVDGRATRGEFTRVPHISLPQSLSLFSSHGSRMQLWLSNHCPLVMSAGGISCSSFPSGNHTCALLHRNFPRSPVRFRLLLQSHCAQVAMHTGLTKANTFRGIIHKPLNHVLSNRF